MDKSIPELKDQYLKGKVSRREFLRYATLLGLSLTAAQSLLAGCAPTPEPTATPKAAAPTPTPKPAAPTATPKPAEGPKYGGEIVFGLTGDPVSLAPFGMLPGIAHMGKEVAYDSLVEYDRDLNMQPALATSWENPDDLTWIFHLRKGVKFHDGKDFKAEDVVYSLTLGPDVTAIDLAASSVTGYMPAIEAVEALDEYTIKITTPEPDATLLGWFAWARWSVIASKDIYEKYNPSLEVNGTGPFKLVEYIPNDRVVYEKFPDFWKPDQPYVDRIIMKVIPDESGRVAALRAGDINVCSVGSYDAVRPLEGDPDIKVIKSGTGQTRVLQIIARGEGKPWDDKRVRQAISMAIDRQDLIDKVYGGQAELTGPVPLGWGPYALPADELAKNPYLQYNPERAKELLAEAGYPDGFEVEMITGNQGTIVREAEVYQAHLSKVGIKVDILALENVQHSAAYREGKYELYCNAQGFRLDPLGKLSHYGMPDKAPQKFWWDFPNGWRNEKMEELYKEAASTFDIPARAKIIHELQRMALEECTFVFICNPFRINVMRKRVQNWFIDFMDFNHALRTVWVEEA